MADQNDSKIPTSSTSESIVNGQSIDQNMFVLVPNVESQPSGTEGSAPFGGIDTRNNHRYPMQQKLTQFIDALGALKNSFSSSKSSTPTTTTNMVPKKNDEFDKKYAEKMERLKKMKEEMEKKDEEERAEMGETLRRMKQQKEEKEKEFEGKMEEYEKERKEERAEKDIQSMRNMAEMERIQKEQEEKDRKDMVAEIDKITKDNEMERMEIEKDENKKQEQFEEQMETNEMNMEEKREEADRKMKNVKQEIRRDEEEYQQKLRMMEEEIYRQKEQYRREREEMKRMLDEQFIEIHRQMQLKVWTMIIENNWNNKLKCLRSANRQVTRFYESLLAMIYRTKGNIEYNPGSVKLEKEEKLMRGYIDLLKKAIEDEENIMKKEQETLEQMYIESNKLFVLHIKNSVKRVENECRRLDESLDRFTGNITNLEAWKTGRYVTEIDMQYKYLCEISNKIPTLYELKEKYKNDMEYNTNEEDNKQDGPIIEELD